MPYEIVNTRSVVEDVLLQVLADLIANGEDVVFSLTVVSGGKVIAGDAIHRNAWLHELQEAMPHEQARGIFEAMEMALRNGDAERDAEEAARTPVGEEPRGSNAGWLNFRNAEIDGAPASTGLIRVNLNSVTAWSVGFVR